MTRLRDIFTATLVAAAGMVSCRSPYVSPRVSDVTDKYETVDTAKQETPAPDPESPFPLPFIERTAWMARHDNVTAADSCLSRQFNDFMKKFDRYKNAPLYAKALAVDSIVDAHLDYAEDSANYNGSMEYFAAPARTVAKKSGDCDDYATLKYEAMRYLGVGDDRVYVMIVSTKGDNSLDHAILAVDTSRTIDKSGVVVLDNMWESKEKTGCAPSLWTTGYKPHYIINRSGTFGVQL